MNLGFAGAAGRGRAEMNMSSAVRHRSRDAFLRAVAQRPAVMGILNVTPDSFSDGGLHHAPDAALAQAKAMAAEGASIIDVGGESTRPGATALSADEEWARVAPVLERLSAEVALPVSIDTMKAAVARRAAELGASVVNDIWGLQGDPEMAGVVAETGSALIVMHNRAGVDPALDILDEIRRFFDRSLAIAAAAGIPEGRVALDPGIGFGKSLEQNLTCIYRLDALATFGLPVLLGVSRKSFLGKALGAPVDKRLNGTLGANMVGLMRGARILRVHDVAEHVEGIRLFEALRNAPNG